MFASLLQDILGALHTASQLSWSDGFGFIVLVSDAPAHGYAVPGMRDEHPFGLVQSLDGVLSELHAKKLELIYCPVCPEASINFDSALEASYKRMMKRKSFSTESNNVVKLFPD